LDHKISRVGSKYNKNSNRNYFQNKGEYISFMSGYRNRVNRFGKQKNGNKETNSTSEINNREALVRWSDKWIAVGTTVLAIATIFLTVYTYFLFKEAVSEGQDQQRIYIADSVNNRKRFKLDSTNFQTQINQLELENRPFLELAELNIDTIQVGQKVKVTMGLFNIGKSPAKIISGGYNFVIQPYSDKENIADEFIQVDEEKSNGVVVNNMHLPLTLNSTALMTPGINHAINNGTWCIYIYGHFKYISLSTNKPYLYTFTYRLKWMKIQFQTIALRYEDEKIAL
jgi:hypothetical protein